jgi:hypothetical protein
MKFPVNISPGSWSLIFFLLIPKYEISPKWSKNPLSVEYAFIGLSSIKKRVKSNQFTYNPQVQTEDVILNPVNPDSE